MEQNREETQLDRGYDALRDGLWQQADGIFSELLQENPGSCLACLGRAMAAEKLHSREELAENWEELSRKPDFQSWFSSAKPDFLPWLQRDMESLISTKEKSSFSLTWPDFSGWLTDFSLASTGRKILLIFAAVQVILYFLTAILLYGTKGYTEDAFSYLLADLILALLFSGIPAILGPIYGNSIVEDGRFRRILKFFNNASAILGCGISGILVAAFWSFVEGDVLAQRADRFYCYAYAAAFLAHFLALVIPMVLSHVEDRE